MPFVRSGSLAMILSPTAIRRYGFEFSLRSARRVVIALVSSLTLVKLPEWMRASARSTENRSSRFV